MTFLVRARARFSQDSVHARALHAWRAAERLVRERWELYLAADRHNRAPMFAAYVRALDREAVAAADLAALFALDPVA